MPELRLGIAMPNRSNHHPLSARGWFTTFIVALGLCSCRAIVGAESAPVVAVPVPPAPTVYLAPKNAAELLKLDPQMEQFFKERVSTHRTSRTLLQEIVAAIIQSETLKFTYDREGTYDVRETFRRRRGNCLSFALLVTAVARAYGFKTSFQSVELASRWDRFGDTIASVQHVNVRVETDDGSYFIDLRPDLVPLREWRSAAVIPDERVFAFFYSDVGFFHLVHGRPVEAMQAMVLATQVDPRCAYAWANRATLHVRLGELAAARVCFERSLQIDRRGINALEGFVYVLQRLGSPEDLRLARELERRAQQERERNPYYHQFLARSAQEKADWNAAEKHLRRAIALKDDEPEFYEQWIAAMHHLGWDDAAQRATTKLEKLRARLQSRSASLVP